MYTINKKFIIFLSLFFVFLLGSLIALLLLLKKTEVNIATRPYSAAYTIKGSQGKTPAKLKLRPGKYDLEITKDNFETIKTSFEVHFFQKKVQLVYPLKSLPVREGDKPSGKEVIEKTMTEYNARFPYAKLLPVQKDTFYISRPSNDGVFNVYIKKNYESRAKEDVYGWFRTQGVKTPEGLKINWKYSN